MTRILKYLEVCRPSASVDCCSCSCPLVVLRLLSAAQKAKPPQVYGLRGFWIKEFKFLNQHTDQKLNCERTEMTRSLSVAPEFKALLDTLVSRRITLCANLVCA